MNMDARKQIVYQVRVKEGQSPDDVVTELTQAVWKALEEFNGPPGADPHRWPALYEELLPVIKKRLSFYKACGAHEECRYSVDIYGQGGPFPAGPTYLLSLRGGLLDFVEALAYLVLRRLRPGEEMTAAQRRSLWSRFQAAIHRALIPYLYYNEACERCDMRHGPPERRIWEVRHRPQDVRGNVV